MPSELSGRIGAEWREKRIRELLDLKFSDLPGLWQHFSMRVTELTDMDNLYFAV